MSYYKYIIKTPKNQQNTTEDAGHEKKATLFTEI